MTSRSVLSRCNAEISFYFVALFTLIRINHILLYDIGFLIIVQLILDLLANCPSRVNWDTETMNGERMTLISKSLDKSGVKLNFRLQAILLKNVLKVVF